MKEKWSESQRNKKAKKERKKEVKTGNEEKTVSETRKKRREERRERGKEARKGLEDRAGKKVCWMWRLVSSKRRRAALIVGCLAVWL